MIGGMEMTTTTSAAAFVVLFCSAMLAGGCTAKNTQQKAPANEGVREITLTPLCSVAASPERYFDTPVRVRALMFYGFEVLKLYSSQCGNRLKNSLRVD